MSSIAMLEKDHKVVGKLILEGELVNVSPLIIGNGQKEISEIDLIRLPNGEVYIPGSSLAGKLSNFFEPYKSQALWSKSVEQFWGSDAAPVSSGQQQGTVFQSHIIIDDARIIHPEASLISKQHSAVKDGVRINDETGIAEHGAKYDFEVLEPGVKFLFRAEVTIREAFDETKFIYLTDFINTILGTDFRIGAFTQAGYGRMTCKKSWIKQFKFNGSSDDDGKNWINYITGLTPTLDQIQSPFIDAEEKLKIDDSKVFELAATFKIKNSFSTSSYGLTAEEPDKTQAHRYPVGSKKKEFVVSGKSIRGALRHRAKKILNTAWVLDPKIPKILNNLFGYVDEKTQKAQRSKIRVDEAVLMNVEVKKQTRIKMDRFTGGTIDGALMETAFVYAVEEDNLTINLLVDKPSDNEVTLILLLLKDLWLSDLPIGGEKNIGRGVLIGREAKLKIKGEDFLISKNDKGGILLDGDSASLSVYNRLKK